MAAGDALQTIREVIDPNGDVIIQVHRTVGPAAVRVSDANGHTNGHNANGLKGLRTAPPPIFTVADDRDDRENGAFIEARDGGGDGRLAFANALEEEENGPLQTVDLVVSSKTLCLVSPVFTALLTGHLREAAELSPATSRVLSDPLAGPDQASALYTLSLPEDDAAAVELLLRLIHFRLGDVYAADGDGVRRGLPGPALLECLAFVCDKYRCTAALQGISDFWVRENMDRLRRASAPQGGRSRSRSRSMDSLRGRSGDGGDADSERHLADWCRLIVFAYVADQPRHFADLCWSLVLHHVGPIYASPPPLVAATAAAIPPSSAAVLASHPLLPHDLAAVLETRRLVSCSLFHAALMSPLLRNWETLGDPQPRGSGAGSRTIGAYVQALRVHGLLSTDLFYSRHSVMSLLDGIRAMPAVAVDADDDVSGNGRLARQNGSHSDASTASAENVTDRLRHDADKIRGDRDSATCLDCFRSQGESARLKTCRVGHS